MFMRFSFITVIVALVLVITGCQRGTNELGHMDAPSDAPEYTVQPNTIPVDK